MRTTGLSSSVRFLSMHLLVLGLAVASACGEDTEDKSEDGGAVSGGGPSGSDASAQSGSSPSPTYDDFECDVAIELSEAPLDGAEYHFMGRRHLVENADGTYLAARNYSTVRCSGERVTIQWGFEGALEDLVPLKATHETTNYESAKVSYHAHKSGLDDVVSALMIPEWTCERRSQMAPTGSFALELQSVEKFTETLGGVTYPFYKLHGSVHAVCPGAGEFPGEGVATIDATW